MHFVLSYDLSAQGEQRNAVEQQIEAILTPYRHVRRLITFYIVQIRTSSDWESIRAGLTELSTTNPSFRFIMSPPMSEGRYDGALQRGEWEEINAISNS